MDTEEILYGAGLLSSLALIGLNNSFDLWSFLGGCGLTICGYEVCRSVYQSYDAMREQT